MARVKVLEDIKIIFFQNHPFDFNETGCKASSSEGESSLFKCGPFPRGDNSENIFLFFPPRITGPISTKLSTKHPLVKRIQASKNEGPQPFPRRDNIEIDYTAKFLLIFFY